MIFRKKRSAPERERKMSIDMYENAINQGRYLVEEIDVWI